MQATACDMDRTDSSRSTRRLISHGGYRRKSVHRAFLIGIFLKGLNGVLEIAGGLMAWVVSPVAVHRFVAGITRHELLEDPHDFVAVHLLRLAAAFSKNVQLFLALYLLSHGLVKLLLVISLWRRRLWAYPTAIAVFALFILYQVYRYTFTHAFSLILLTMLDLIIIVLTLLEYQSVKRDTEERRHLLEEPESSVL